MKLQDILFIGVLTFVTMWAFNYFFPPRGAEKVSPDIRSGQTFKAAANAQMCLPKNVEIDFLDGEQIGTTSQEVVAGNHSTWGFSSDGASLDRLSFDRDLGGKPGEITTIWPVGQNEKEDRAFLLALNDPAPYYYKFVEKKVEQGKTVVTYRSEIPSAWVTKTFVVYHNSYKMDVKITIEPASSESSIQPRIFFPAPVVPGVEGDATSGVVNTTKGSISKINPKNMMDTAWAVPSLFGAEDRYFVNALVADPDGFVQRGYFKSQDGKLFAILEGPSISKATSWTLSFYCGPKESAAFALVDKRLDGVLDYGWFTPVSKLFLYILNFVYSYTHNYGWAIVIIALLLRLLMMPFIPSTQDTTRRKKELDKKMRYLEQRYSGDREGLAKAKMELYREQGLFSQMGCLPILIQIPVFIGLNSALRYSILLYKAPFIWWIKDLSAKDPYYVLPLLIGLGAFLSFAQTTNDPRYKISMFFVGLFLAGIMMNLPAGLGLFFCVSGLFGVVQSFVTKRFKKA